MFTETEGLSAREIFEKARDAGVYTHLLKVSYNALGGAGSGNEETPGRRLVWLYRALESLDDWKNGVAAPCRVKDRETTMPGAVLKEAYDLSKPTLELARLAL